MEEVLLKQIDHILEEINTLDDYVRTHELHNEQWFLDFQDRLNEISIK